MLRERLTWQEHTAGQGQNRIHNQVYPVSNLFSPLSAMSAWRGTVVQQAGLIRWGQTQAYREPGSS